MIPTSQILELVSGFCRQDTASLGKNVGDRCGGFDGVVEAAVVMSSDTFSPRLCLRLGEVARDARALPSGLKRDLQQQNNNSRTIRVLRRQRHH